MDASKHALVARMFKYDKPENAIAELCSVSVDAPSQLRTQDGFHLLVGAWFDVMKDSFDINGDQVQVSFGLKAAKLTVGHCDNTRIAMNDRHEPIVYREKITLNEKDSTEKSGEAGGGVSVETPKSWGFASFVAKLGGDYKRAVQSVQTKTGEFERVYRRFWNPGHNYWRALGASPIEGESEVLDEQIIGAEPLCRIIQDGESAEIEVSISTSLGDLWLDYDGLDDAELSEAKANRTAVCKAIFARGINTKGRRKTKQSNPENDATEVVLATAKMHSPAPGDEAK
jgi:hypothetical protein